MYDNNNKKYEGEAVDAELAKIKRSMQNSIYATAFAKSTEEKSEEESETEADATTKYTDIKDTSRDYFSPKYARKKEELSPEFKALLKMHENDNLVELQKKLLEKDRLFNMKRKYQDRLDSLNNQLENQRVILATEEFEVEQLEKISMANLINVLTGGYKEALNKEKMDVILATDKFNSLVANIKFIEGEIEDLNEQLKALGNVKTQFYLAYKAKKTKIMECGDKDAERLFSLEDRMIFLESTLKEIKEALSAGQIAFREADKVYHYMQKIENTNEIGTLVGVVATLPINPYIGMDAGGLVGNVAYGSSLNNNFDLMNNRIERFLTELQDVDLGKSIYSDNEFRSLMFVTKTYEDVNNCMFVINQQLIKLENKKTSCEKEIAEVQKAMEAIVISRE